MPLAPSLHHLRQPSPPARAAGWLALWLSSLVVCCLSAAGCKDFKVTADTLDAGLPDATEGGAGGSEAQAACTPGDARCAQEVLQQCGDDQVWRPRQVCASAELCQTDPALCDVPACLSSELRCNGAMLERCNDAQTNWEMLRDCGDASRCNATQMTCTEDPCSEGDFQCSGAELQSCRADGGGWDTLNGCESAALCDAEEGVCLDSMCERSDTRCSGAQFEQCALNLNGWERVASCASAQLCDDDLGCLTISCELGEYRCEGNQLLNCNAEQNGFDVVDTCASPAHCNAEGQRCTESPCRAATDAEPAEYQCNGPVLERCLDDRSAWEEVDTCDSATLCQSSPEPECLEALCQAGSYACDGAELQQCNDGRTAWESVSTCATERLCELGAAASQGECAPPTCATGEHRCVNGNSELQICSEGRDAYEPKEDCEANQCDAEAGVCAPCSPGTWSCNAGALQFCEPIFGLVFQQQCATAALCDAANMGCQAPPCANGEFRCSADGDVERCNDDRTGWEVAVNCTASQVCDAVNGQCDVCEANTTTCNGDVREICDAQGQNFTQQQCAQGRCSPNGCIICQMGAFSCTQSNILNECDASGMSFTQRADCGFAGNCQAAQQRCCTPNSSLGCSGDASAALYCSGNGLSSVSDACDLSGQDTCQGGVCIGCDPNSSATRCNGAGTAVQDCSTGLWADSMSCTFGCISVSGQGQCAPECMPGGPTSCTPDGLGWRSCGDDGLWSTTSTACEFGCIAALGECAPECNPDTDADDCDGDQPQTCSASGRWVAVGAPCDNACQDGVCVECVSNTECTSSTASRCAGINGCQGCLTANDCSHLSGYNACLGQECVQCSSNGHCTNSELCDTETGECVECLSNSDCNISSSPICGADGSCRPCQGAADCSADEVCDDRSGSQTEGQCIGCRDNADCEANANGLDFCGDNGQCFECDGVMGCETDQVCTGSGVCVDCLVNAECTDPAASRCNASNTCVPCTIDAECSHIPNTGLCDNGVCAACASDADCDDNDDCTDDSCDAGGACVNAAITCAAAGVCEQLTGCQASGGCQYAPTPGADCTGADLCMEYQCGSTQGVCEPIGPVTCDPAPNACVVVSCNSMMGCQSQNLDGQCSAGTLCSMGMPITCPNGCDSGGTSCCTPLAKASVCNAGNCGMTVSDGCDDNGVDITCDPCPDAGM